MRPVAIAAMWVLMSCSATPDEQLPGATTPSAELAPGASANGAGGVEYACNDPCPGVTCCFGSHYDTTGGYYVNCGPDSQWINLYCDCWPFSCTNGQSGDACYCSYFDPCTGQLVTEDNTPDYCP
jgi:hypothetical protein